MHNIADMKQSDQIRMDLDYRRIGIGEKDAIKCMNQIEAVHQNFVPAKLFLGYLKTPAPYFSDPLRSELYFKILVPDKEGVQLFLLTPLSL